MAARFSSTTEEQIKSLVNEAIPVNTKKSTSFALNVFNGESMHEVTLCDV